MSFDCNIIVYISIHKIIIFFQKKKHYTVQIVTENQIISKIYLIK